MSQMSINDEIWLDYVMVITDIQNNNRDIVDKS